MQWHVSEPDSSDMQTTTYWPRASMEIHGYVNSGMASSVKPSAVRTCSTISMLQGKTGFMLVHKNAPIGMLAGLSWQRFRLVSISIDELPVTAYRSSRTIRHVKLKAILRRAEFCYAVRWWPVQPNGFDGDWRSFSPASC